MRAPRFLLAVVALALLQSAAFAADGSRLDKLDSALKNRFAKADANHDGRLTPDEAKAGMPRVYRNFAAIDSRHQGYLTVDDLENWVAAKVAARGKPAGN